MRKNAKRFEETDVIVNFMWQFLFFACFCISPKTFLTLLKKITMIAWNSSITEIQELKKLCECFLLECQIAFVKDFMCNNFHLLLHLHEDILQFGPCCSHVMFKFESFNHDLIMMVNATSSFQQRFIYRFYAKTKLELYFN